MQVPYLPGTRGVVADREDPEHLGAARCGDSRDELAESLLHLGQVHERRVALRPVRPWLQRVRQNAAG